MSVSVPKIAVKSQQKPNKTYTTIPRCFLLAFYKCKQPSAPYYHCSLILGSIFSHTPFVGPNVTIDFTANTSSILAASNSTLTALSKYPRHNNASRSANLYPKHFLGPMPNGKNPVGVTASKVPSFRNLSGLNLSGYGK